MNPAVTEIPVITPTDYTGMTERELLIRLDGKVDTHMAVTTSRLGQHGDVLEDHETRIRELAGDNATIKAELVEMRTELARRITPAKLWGFVVGAIAATAALVDVVSHFHK